MYEYMLHQLKYYKLLNGVKSDLVCLIAVGGPRWNLLKMAPKNNIKVFEN